MADDSMRFGIEFEFRDQFSRHAAVVERLRDHFALGEKSYVWVADVFGDAAVASVSKGDSPGGNTLYQVSWARGGGEFKIGEPVEVVRRTTYVPKSKSAAVRKSLWDGVL